MNIASAAALAFAALAAGAMTFQLGLALGLPWGAYAMGGKFPGRFPAPMRIAAVAQALVLGLLAAAVLARAGLVFESSMAAAWPVWIAVAFSATGLVLNLATSSPGERRLWAPVAFGMLASSLAVALAG